MPSLPLSGGCQCGAVRYHIKTAPLMIYNCHCTTCQKVSASAFNVSVSVFAGGLETVKGEPHQTVWQSAAGNQRYGKFCRDCGTRLSHGGLPEGPVYSLRGGSLDDTSWLIPVADIWTQSALPWVDRPADRLQFSQQPKDYSDIIAAFAKLNLF